MPRLPDAIAFDCPPEADPARCLPLQGITVLAVEDSRFACDALRLLCQRSGARLRRAESLAAAREHLRTYRPDVLLIDLGLPDGRGDGLIRRLAAAGAGRPALIGISGDPDGRAAALAAGADAFLEKPLPGPAAFQQALAAVLPGRSAAAPAAHGEISPDPAALHDDLAQAAAVLAALPGPEERRYLAGFLSGLARQSSDSALGAASASLGDPDPQLQGLSRLIGERLAETAPFRPGAA